MAGLSKKERQIYARLNKKRNVVIAICSVIVLFFILLRNASATIRVAGTVGLIVLLYVVDHLSRIDFKDKHYVYIILIAVGGMLLSPFYFNYSFYDKILHFTLPILFSSIVFHTTRKLPLTIKSRLLFTFTIVVATLAVFEVGEYALDSVFDGKLQGVFQYQEGNWGINELAEFTVIQEPIDDTMIDIALGILGSLLYWVTVLVLSKKKTKASRS